MPWPDTAPRPRRSKNSAAFWMRTRKTMARLDSWLSADLTHALGWALIHSLWQCLGLGALAAVLMVFSRRPSVRYLIATGILVAMLAAPAATFLILIKPAAPAHMLIPASPGPHFSAPPVIVSRLDTAPVTQGAAMAAAEDSQKHFVPSLFSSRDFLQPNI